MTMARSFRVTAMAEAAAGLAGNVVEADAAGGDAGGDDGRGTFTSARFVVAED